MARLIFASLITFGLLVGMVIGCVLAAMVSMGEVDLTVAIALTVVINLLIWLISPWLSDLTLRWFNKLEFLDDATVKQRYAGVHQLIHQVADEYRFTAPRIGFIPDRNPTAFTYGLLRSNARIVVTQGIFEFLSEDEQRAVVAHELGHIVNRDFILMTMAGMLVQILYQVYAALMRSSGGSSDKKGKGAIIGLAALLCYYIGIYLLLYLSRTREYLADAFSASRRAATPRQCAHQDRLRHRRGRGHRGHAEPVAQHAASRRDRRQERPLYRPPRRECGQEPRQRRRGHAVRHV
ncbi:MAG: M48 family metalloprotease [Methyloceanibacter sp.]|nr:M48 family metalloprotease [Methyloceanibacter sp.]